MEQRVALISGANRGIGKAITERLFAEGWNVSLGMRHGHDEWQQSSNAHVHYYDALKGGEAEWVKATLDRFGRIDAVIANAGVSIPKSVVDIEDEDFDSMWAINVRAPQRLAKAAFEALSLSGKGRIIIMASLSGKRVASVDSSAYAVTKHAAVALAHGLRQAGFNNGIRATAICPSFVATDMGIGLAPQFEDQMTTPENIAQIVSSVLNLPNNASVAEVGINWRAEPLY